MIQVAIGGDPKRMVMGKFLPCVGQHDKPQSDIRCACGFIFEGLSQSVVHNCSRCRCKCAKC